MKEIHEFTYPPSLPKMHNCLSTNSDGNENSSPWPPAPSSWACEHEQSNLKASNSRGSTVSDGQSCQDGFFLPFNHSSDSMVTCSAPLESSSDSGSSGQLPPSGDAIYFLPRGQSATQLIPQPQKLGLWPGVSPKGGCMQKPIYLFIVS